MKTIAMLIATLALASNAYAANKECKPGKDLEYKCEPSNPNPPPSHAENRAGNS
jgi:hypothetical protein